MNISYVLAHFIGDFLLQNDWMAVGKKRSNFICTVHIFFYMIPFLLVDLNWIQFILIAVQHWIQDRTGFIRWYCKTFRLFQSELNQTTLPWGHFIVDQIFHFIWMYLVFNSFL